MEENNFKSVLIDPGHGGKDPGASYNGVNEKTLNLTLGALVYAGIMRENNDLVAYMTRGIDEFVELGTRQKIANEETECFCLVSLHCNAAQDTSANGIEIWFHPEDIPGFRLAEIVYKKLTALNLFKPRGLKPSSSLAMLKCRAPECLVEFGFLSNDRDRATLVNSENQVKLAEAVRLGIQEFMQGET